MCLLSLQEELEDEDQWAPKKGVWQSYGFQRESSQTKVTPTINATKGVHLVKGGHILEYRVKANALSKPRSNHPSTTLDL